MYANDCEENQAALLLRLAAGDPDSFRMLYEKYWEQAYADAYRRLKDRDQAKDIVQEIFTSIWHRRDALRIVNLPAYLATAVRNRVFKVLARQQVTHPFFDFLQEMPAGSLQTDANLLWKEFLHSYEAFIAALPARKQLIFRLRFQEDLSTAEIARQLGLSQKTVQNQIGRVIEHLRVHLHYIIKTLLLLAPFLGDSSF